MSSMAYENLKGEEDHERMEIDDEKFEYNFRGYPDPDEIQEGYENGPLYPQADIDLNKIIKTVVERAEDYSEW